MPAVVPDPPRTADGRGAWLHFDARCLDTARRRGAFSKALKNPGAVDVQAVVRFIDAHGIDEQH